MHRPRSGARGQYLNVIPSKNIVAVRMRRKTAADATSGTELDGFRTFFVDVNALVP